MEKEKVIRYKELCEEYQDAKRVVLDSVHGSSTEFPWGMRTYKLEGRLPQKSEYLEYLQAQIKEVEDFIPTLPWSKRKLAKAVMKYGTKWQIIKWALKSDKSPDALRVEFDRIFEKN